MTAETILIDDLFTAKTFMKSGSGSAFGCHVTV